MENSLAGVPRWSIRGDWFDVCKCNVACPCAFAQAPTHGDCENVLAWHIRAGRYGDVLLNGLNVVSLGAFEGNLWANGAPLKTGLFLDGRAHENQREALRMIFSGEAGGWPGEFSKLIGEMRGIEFARIVFEVAEDLASWRAEIPGRVYAKAEALAGPTPESGERVQLLNMPGSVIGPGSTATLGTATLGKAEAFGFSWNWSGTSSKHMRFEWSGPDTN